MLLSTLQRQSAMVAFYFACVAYLLPKAFGIIGSIPVLATLQIQKRHSGKFRSASFMSQLILNRQK